MNRVTISAINLKGGSSKTSLILNLGGVLHEAKRRPILIDLDPQRSATRWAVQGGTSFPFPVIPLEIKDARQFKTSIDNLVKNHSADTILFDTPPAIQDESLIAALLSDLVLIPVTSSPLDIWAADQAIKTVKEAREERKGLPNIVLVPSRLILNTTLAKEIHTPLKQFGEPIAPAISMRVAMAEAAIAGLPVNLYAPNSQSHKEFKDLLKFVNTHIPK